MILTSGHFDTAHTLCCRYFEDVRRAVMARLGRLSNDELAGEEEVVMTVMSLLGELMSVVDVNFNVRDWCTPSHNLVACIDGSIALLQWAGFVGPDLCSSGKSGD